MDSEPVVERAPEYRGWRIRSADQAPGTGMVVTDDWLRSFGFLQPTRFNIDKIILATKAVMMGMTAGGPGERSSVDLEREAKVFGDPFSERGAADGIEHGEGVGKVF